jgi:hypothetical protein
VHAGLARRYRVELRLESTDPAIPPARLAATVPDGGLLLEDAREIRSWPCRTSLGTKVTYARPRSFRLGHLVLASPASRGPEAAVLRLLILSVGVRGERRIESPGLTLVAPELATIALVADVPARPGKPGVLRLAAADGFPGATLTWKLAPVDSDPAPTGTRVHPVHALRPLLADPTLPSPDRPVRWKLRERAPKRPEVPEAWHEIRDVRLLPVAPGLVVLEGAEENLRHTDALIAAWWRSRPSDLALTRTGGGLDDRLPMASGAPLRLAFGRLVPTVERVEVNVAEDQARAASHFGWTFAGRRIEIDAVDAGVRVLRERIHVEDDRPGSRLLRREDLDGDAADEIAFGSPRVIAERSSTILRPGERVESTERNVTRIVELREVRR